MVNQISTVSAREIVAAQQRLSRLLHPTPLKPSFDLSRRIGGSVLLKMENMQDTGSFKIRGAANFMYAALEAGKLNGVIAASSGNHGRSVAYVARQLGIKATICMTTLVPADKIRSIEEFGAEVVIHGNDQNETVEKAADIAAQTQQTLIPPFDDPLVIAGQGTIGLELLQQCPELDVLVIPVGGGGLISGTAMAARSINPDIQIIGVTSAKNAAMVESIKAGEVVMVGEDPSIADALAGPIPLDNRFTFEMCRNLVDEIVRIDDKKIALGMRHAIDEEKLVLEGGGAASIALLLDDGSRFKGKKVAAICSGCNISKERLNSIFKKFHV